jgi:oligopeptide/dipeptide ABC transporter ATP-binding protein
MSPLIAAQALARSFRTPAGLLQAVRGVDLTIGAGASLGLVGESGCGKSTLARLLLGILPPTNGTLLVRGAPPAPAGSAAWRTQRADLQLVAQDPLASLNPRLPVGRQVAEGLVAHGRARDFAAAMPAVLRMLDRVGLAAALASRFPHQLSGGQRQRVAIARALVLRPSLLVLDEPVSALDVSVQAQVVVLLRELQAEAGTTQVFVSHDLRVVRHVADRVAVMYAGQIVEEAPAAQLYAGPAHPYTRALLAALPPLTPGARRAAPMPADAGPPSPLAPPGGCAFHPRCPMALPVCRSDAPVMRRSGPDRRVACHVAADARISLAA